MSTIIDSIERRQLRTDVPRFKAGDTVRVHFQVIEGQRRRVQVFEGVVIKRQGSGVRETFTVRKQSFGVGVERTFPLHSPKIEKIEVGAVGDVNRAKLYYLRGRVGKKARIREKRSARARSRQLLRSRGLEPVDDERPRRETVADGAARRLSSPASRRRPAPPPLRPSTRRALRRRRRRGRARVPRRPARRRRRAARPRLPAGPPRPAARAALNDSKQVAPERARCSSARSSAAPSAICVHVIPPARSTATACTARTWPGCAGAARGAPPAEACLVDGFRLGRLRRRTAPSSTATRRAPRSPPPRSSRRSRATASCAGSTRSIRDTASPRTSATSRPVTRAVVRARARAEPSPLVPGALLTKNPARAAAAQRASGSPRAHYRLRGYRNPRAERLGGRERARPRPPPRAGARLLRGEGEGRRGLRRSAGDGRA